MSWFQSIKDSCHIAEFDDMIHCGALAHGMRFGYITSIVEIDRLSKDIQMEVKEHVNNNQDAYAYVNLTYFNNYMNGKIENYEDRYPIYLIYRQEIPK